MKSEELAFQRPLYKTIPFVQTAFKGHTLRMATERVSPRSLARFTEDLQGRGRYTFTKQEAVAALHISDNAFHKAAHRLIREKRLMRVVNEFYAAIPAEYRPGGSIPATYYIDALMKFRQQPYYVGVLSAASLHGAAHQAPQEYQIVTSAPLPMIRAPRTRIRFLTKQNIADTPVQQMKTPAGYISVSTPEATAFDLLRYPRAAAGLNNIATILTELSEVIDPKKLTMLAEKTESSYVQRLGYLMDQVGAEKLTSSLAGCLAKQRWDYVSLRPGWKSESPKRDSKWRVIVNETVEADI